MRYEDLLLQPERTLRELCPLLGRTMRTPIVAKDHLVSPEQNRSATYAGSHNLSAVCHVRAVAEAYTEEDLRVTAGVTGPVAQLYGYEVRNLLRGGGRMRASRARHQTRAARREWRSAGTNNLIADKHCIATRTVSAQRRPPAPRRSHQRLT